MVKGYKVFNSDWTCRGKQYCCPGTFEEDVDLKLCEKGMHFCKKLVDCFNYYPFNPKNKVAEVCAEGDVLEDGDKSCTNKLRIVRELTWQEVLDLVNIGDWNSGYGNSGNGNSGDWNSGNRNIGDRNSGNGNSGNRNSGNRNSGDWNSGDWNSGNGNSGNRNSGNRNSGYGNSGNWNSGNRNSGYGNSGDWNSGNRNSGDWNSGNRNSGNGNSGDWNSCDYSSGCFCTTSENVRFFNKESELTFDEWRQSRACLILARMPKDELSWVNFSEMSEVQKKEHKDAETCGGYLRLDQTDNMARQKWWDLLSPEDKKEILSLPNFDAEIFKQITGIDVLKGAKK